MDRSGSPMVDGITQKRLPGDQSNAMIWMRGLVMIGGLIVALAYYGVPDAAPTGSQTTTSSSSSTSGYGVDLSP
jgi:hypothetical protein